MVVQAEEPRPWLPPVLPEMPPLWQRPPIKAIDEDPNRPGDPGFAANDCLLTACDDVIARTMGAVRVGCGYGRPGAWSQVDKVSSRFFLEWKSKLKVVDPKYVGSVDGTGDFYLGTRRNGDPIWVVHKPPPPPQGDIVCLECRDGEPVWLDPCPMKT